MPEFDPTKIVEQLRLHNDALEAVLSPEGIEQLDRLVLLEALAAARIKTTLDDLADGEVRAVARGADIDQARLSELQALLGLPDYVKDLVEKCKNVLNDKVKRFVTNTAGAGGAADDGDGTGG